MNTKKYSIRTQIILSVLILLQCAYKTPSSPTTKPVDPPIANAENQVLVGAAQLDALLPKLQNKKIALVVNHTTVIGKTHLVDTLKSRGINITKIFAPEHGFRGTAEAGETIKDGIDSKTGVPVVSLYGSNKKPTPEQLIDTDVLIFDIQDVGVRFYTYISTLHYVMEACAEQQKKLIVLDRPNPNGNYVDGPILRPELKSFIGMHPIPIVHGLTIGELALMINGEGWLGAGKKCELEIIQIKNWKHQDPYSISIRPSPNLPNDQAIKLYPSLCLFEGTEISLGRGTEIPFQIIGNPQLKNMPFQFTPVSIEGMAKNPPHENKVCYGLDLRNVKVEPGITLKYLIQMYNAYPDKGSFFLKNNFIDKLAGTPVFQQQIKDGLTEEQIKESWKKDLEAYQQMRTKYLLYP